MEGIIIVLALLYIFHLADKDGASAEAVDGSFECNACNNHFPGRKRAGNHDLCTRCWTNMGNR